MIGLVLGVTTSAAVAARLIAIVVPLRCPRNREAFARDGEIELRPR